MIPLIQQVVFKKKKKHLSETDPTHTVHETGLNIFNET